MKNKLFILVIFFIGVILLTGCSDDYNNNNTNNTTDNTKKCNMGEYEIDGRCCRSIYRYPNKDGTCPVGYDDDPPAGGNRNVCWKETCR